VNSQFSAVDSLTRSLVFDLIIVRRFADTKLGIIASAMLKNPSLTNLVATMVRQVERKALHIHNLLIVSRGHNLSTAYAVFTLHGGIGQLPVWKVGNPLSSRVVS
jgi:transketolase N-terminal domain/subunit